MTSIGIIGAGQIGSAIAQQLARLGIKATIANSRGPQSLGELVRQIGPSITAGTRDEAASKDIVFLAVPWKKLEEALAGLPDFGNRIVVDTTNPLQKQPLPSIDIDGQASSALVARLVPGARLVKAFNHHAYWNLAADPAKEGGQRILFYAGEDAAAKAEIASLIERLGFFGADMGNIENGSRLFQPPAGPLAGPNLVKMALRG
ncbi:NADPH-dependent F420 reductase [Pseudomonas putida]|uniref:NADPH-dependent F420 reductase n=1 Tax=Pseudomonas putida TaxID=303 RepID=UPI0008193930|nr:NAD(P)-binding domain-containing protein [Pseudomonas putida]OCT31013.1 NADP oxidoreductase [Pseudomonas putida]OCT33039.1 NADP oxidoreductase [Pseudomonas putida]OCT35553.1 NADP oxidoreductase [Pseudomonas putida]OCT41523.1 NADP oxidoreductase [Pseudomonas putida]